MGLVEVLWADVERREFGQRGRRTQAALFDILYLVVGDEVLRNAAYGEGEGLAERREKVEERGEGTMTDLFHEAVGLELVAVGEAADEDTFTLSVEAERARLALGPAEGLALEACAVHVVLRVLVDGLWGLCTHASVAGTTLVRFAVEEKVAKDAGGAPEEAVCPALDATLVLVKDKDGPGGDHFSFRVYETAGDSRDEAAACGFEDEEGIAGGLYPAGPGGLCPGRGGLGRRGGRCV